MKISEILLCINCDEVFQIGENRLAGADQCPICG